MVNVLLLNSEPTLHDVQHKVKVEYFYVLKKAPFWNIYGERSKNITDKSNIWQKDPRSPFVTSS